jgi:endonuclease/exonuclease/phosphatase family metal-dependent hydrolase
VQQVMSRRPDVIGFQEASQGHVQGTNIPQFIDLRSRLRAAGGAYEITNAVPYNCQRPQTPIGCVPQNRNASQGTRIFFNTKTVSLVSQGSKLLPSCAGCNNRYFAWAILKQKASGKSFFFADIHTQFMPKYADLRRAEVRVMMDEIARRNAKRLPVFVVGDFNSTRYQSPSNAPYDEVIERGLVDPLGHTPKSPAVSPRGTAENRIRANYNSHNNFLRAVARFAEWENGSNLDYIFTTPMRVLLWETVLNVDAHDRIIGTIPSDHNLILIKAVLP